MAPGATDTEIKAAYRAEARRLHPDARGGLANDEMAALNESWRVLRDPQRRSSYDASLRAGPGGGSGSGTSGSAAGAPWSGTPGGEPVRYGPPPGAAPHRVAPGGFNVKGFLLVSVLAMLALIVVFTAFAGKDPVDRFDPGAGVDGYLSAGDCVLLGAGDVAGEVPCTASHDGRVVTLNRLDVPCEVGVQPFRSNLNNLRVCVALISGP